MGLFDKLARWRDQRVIANAPLTEAEWQASCGALPFLAGLNERELARLRELVVLFLDAKEMSGADGLALTNAIRLSVAIQACLPILELGLQSYEGWVGIVVYPGEFVAPRELQDEIGLVHEYDETMTGEAWEGGPVILSWEDASHAGDAASEGYNVVIHEFAHKLDMLSGEPDGTPPLHAEMDRGRWQAALSAAYEDFCRKVDDYEDACDRAEENGGAGYPGELPIDPYASEHPSEFFAVMSEAFFVAPWLVRQEYPAVYEQFVLFYRQDPATRLQPHVP
jgi:MtfA peptidase